MHGADSRELVLGLVLFGIVMDIGIGGMIQMQNILGRIENNNLEKKTILFNMDSIVCLYKNN